MAMKCCMITPYPPERCGIAIYSSKLATHLQQYLSVCVVGNRTNARIIDVTGRLKIVRCWTRNSLTYARDIVKVVKQENPDVIHVEHEYLSYGRPRYGILFPLVLALLRPLRRPLILTMHSVLRRRKMSADFLLLHQVGSEFSAVKRSLIVLFTKIIIALADHVIVHSQEMRTVLMKDYSVPDRKIAVVFHGMDSHPVNTDAKEAKKELGLFDKFVFLFFGFVVPSKGIEILLRSFSEVSTLLHNAVLVLAGGYHPRLPDELPQYLGTIEKVIGELQLADKVTFRNHYVSSECLEKYIAAADIVVFPYVDDIIVGVSGAVATCAGMGKAIIASDLPRFTSDIENGHDGILVQPNSYRELSSAMVRLAGDEQLREIIGHNLRDKASSRNWARTAFLTYELYQKDIRERLSSE